MFSGLVLYSVSYLTGNIFLKYSGTLCSSARREMSEVLSIRVQVQSIVSRRRIVPEPVDIGQCPELSSWRETGNMSRRR